jgi:hypothetical protein
VGLILKFIQDAPTVTDTIDLLHKRGLSIGTTLLFFFLLTDKPAYPAYRQAGGQAGMSVLHNKMKKLPY